MGATRAEALAWPHREYELNYPLAQWRDALGVEISSKIIEWSEYLDLVYNHPPQLWRMGWMPDYPDPDAYLRVPIPCLHRLAREARDHRAPLIGYRTSKSGISQLSDKWRAMSLTR